MIKMAGIYYEDEIFTLLLPGTDLKIESLIPLKDGDILKGKTEEGEDLEILVCLADYPEM